MFIYTMEHEMSIGSLKMSDLRSYCGKTQTWYAFPIEYFLCGARTITSKFGCHTLPNCTMMIHHGTYL
jgi:hypothetical protein